MIIRILLTPLIAVAVIAFAWFLYQVFALGLKEFFGRKDDKKENNTHDDTKKNKKTNGR